MGLGYYPIGVVANCVSELLGIADIGRKPQRGARHTPFGSNCRPLWCMPDTTLLLQRYAAIQQSCVWGEGRSVLWWIHYSVQTAGLYGVCRTPRSSYGDTLRYSNLVCGEKAALRCAGYTIRFKLQALIAYPPHHRALGVACCNTAICCAATAPAALGG